METLATGPILITDIGSTSTKALLLDYRGSASSFLCEVEVPTTVEKPAEDVKIGIRRVAERIETETGLRLLDPQGEPAIPYLTTSSAGGGLQMLVFGLTAADTGEVARMTAHAAGAVILKSFTIDDRIPVIHKMRMIRDLHPDVILLAGGVDGGNIANLVWLAEVLSLGNPTPKAGGDYKLPLVYCGNPDARAFAEQVLAEKFDLHVVDNIRPTLLDIHPEPARDKILELFMDNVMERAPGYAGLRDWTAADILPTPIAVESILRLHGDETGESIVMLDMGGATTDVFSNIYGNYSRTVAANIGMSYSICNVLAEAGYARIAAHLPAGYTEGEVRNSIANKMLSPDRLPGHASEIRIEQALATEGIALAWRQHRDANFRVAEIGILDRLKNRVDYDPFEEAFWGIDTSFLFQVSDIQTLVGTGGVIAHADSDAAALGMLVDGVKPAGITRIAVDRHFKSPHLGLLATLDPQTALALFRQECLRDIATVVAPIGKLTKGKDALTLSDRRTRQEYVVKGGDVLYLPEGGDFTMRSAAGSHVTKHRELVELATELPLLIDCRGRGRHFIGKPLAACGLPEFGEEPDLLVAPPRLPGQQVERRQFELRRSLPYEGEIFVKPGDRVEPDTVIGENVFTPPQVYIIDVQRIVGYERELSPEEIATGILVKAGDEVRAGQKIFRVSGGLAGAYYCRCPVRGRVKQIESSGLIILQEIQDYSRKPLTVDVAKQLGVAPKQIRRYLQFKAGDFVHRDETLAKGAETGPPLKAPTTGTLKVVDTKTGKVVLQYDLAPIQLRSFVQGRVERVESGLHADIVGEGNTLHGRIGFGSERVGAIAAVAGKRELGSEHRGKIVVSRKPVDREFLNACAAADVAGLIAPSLDNGEWVAFSGKEIGVASTGDEDIPFTIVLTEGFGSLPMNDAYGEFLAESAGRIASITGRTQIRAGVKRPLAIVFD